MNEQLVWLGLVFLGVTAGSYGTVVGAGGGFFLTPLLVLLYPEYPPHVITAISLAVVASNALSGSIAYGKQKRIDYLVALLFSAATIPSAILGALATELIPRRTFEIAFGLLLFAVASWLFFPLRPYMQLSQPAGRHLRRFITDCHSHTFGYTFDPVLGCLAGLVIGLISSLFGIGGGIIYVPVMVLLLRFPIWIATATSTLILLVTSGVGALVHLAEGHYSGVIEQEILLSIGVVIGAQVGAAVSMRLEAHQGVITRLLSIGLLVVSLRLVLWT